MKFFKFHFLILATALKGRRATERTDLREVLGVGRWGWGRCHLFADNRRGAEGVTNMGLM